MGRPKGSGKQLSGTVRAIESRKARLNAGGERYEVIISKEVSDKKADILRVRTECGNSKTALLETLIEEEWRRLKKHGKK